MAHSGYFPIEELKTLRKLGTRLQGHPHREYLPFVENSSGPLGEGLSQAIGMALADRMDEKDTGRFIYCFMSDGELDEGNSWEAIMLAGKHKLNNLIAVIDRNNIQIDGYTEHIMPLEPLADKWRAFNWHVIEVGGHDFKTLNEAVEEAQKIFEKPTVIIAHTIPGKGVSFMERIINGTANRQPKKKAKWHLKNYKMLNPKLKLNPKIFNQDCEQAPTRKGFGQGLLLAGEADKNVVALCADLTESTQMNLFAEKFPKRFIEMGVAEQNLVTVSSGMAAMGKIPFVLLMRCFLRDVIGNK